MQRAYLVMIEECHSIMAVHCVDGGEGLAVDARAQYRTEFPGRSARRMTHLGMMVTLCLRELGVQKHIPVVYASEFAESESLEKFIESFPSASPSLFQTSIHPSSVEQGLIPTQTAIDRFYPVTCDSNLPGKALENCMVLSEGEVILVGGEERATWLCEHGLASARSFAYGLRLKCGVHPGIGKLFFEPKAGGVTHPGIESHSFAQALRRREQIRIPADGLGGSFRIEWS